MNTLSLSKPLTPASHSAASHRGLADAMPLVFLSLWIILVGFFFYAFARTFWAQM